MKKILISLLAICSLSNALALEKILSERPVKIPLPTNSEIIIKFPYAVVHTEIIDGNKNPPMTKFLRPDGILMLTAKEAFGDSRMVAPMVNGDVVVLDLSATTGAVNHEIITLIDPKSIPKPKQVKKVTKPTEVRKETIIVEQEIETPKENPNKPAFLKDGGEMTLTKGQDSSSKAGFNDMVRYAFRNFSGPARLIDEQQLNATKVGVQSISNEKFLRVWNHRVSVQALEQWKIDDKYVTVLFVNNHSNQNIYFDPRALRGRFMFAAALNETVEPQGSFYDQTLWAVISAVPFNQAVQ